MEYSFSTPFYMVTGEGIVYKLVDNSGLFEWETININS